MNVVKKCACFDTLANLLYATGYFFSLFFTKLLSLFPARKISRKTRQKSLKVNFTDIYPEFKVTLKQIQCKLRFHGVLTKLTYEHARKICKTGSDDAYNECYTCTTGIQSVLRRGYLFSHQNIRATKKLLVAGDWELNSTGYSLPHIKFRLINHLGPQNAAKQHMTKY